MIDIFEKLAPQWKNTVARYARAIWTNSDLYDDDINFDNKAVLFSREYRNELEKHYRKKGMNVFRGTLDGWVTEWLRKQEALKGNLKTIASEKQNKP